MFKMYGGDGRLLLLVGLYPPCPAGKLVAVAVDVGIVVVVGGGGGWGWLLYSSPTPTPLPGRSPGRLVGNVDDDDDNDAPPLPSPPFVVV